MAKYDVTYSCGHSETVQLYGPTRDRQRKIEWMERDGLCPECFKAHKEAKQAEKEAKAVEGLELVALTGSEKQIKWADSLRAQTLADVRRRVENVRASKGDTVADNVLAASTSAMNRYPDAKFWIDNRDNLLTALGAAYREEAIKLGLDKVK